MVWSLLELLDQASRATAPFTQPLGLPCCAGAAGSGLGQHFLPPTMAPEHWAGLETSQSGRCNQALRQAALGFQPTLVPSFLDHQTLSQTLALA